MSDVTLLIHVDDETECDWEEITARLDAQLDSWKAERNQYLVENLDSGDEPAEILADFEEYVTPRPPTSAADPCPDCGGSLRAVELTFEELIERDVGKLVQATVELIGDVEMVAKRQPRLREELEARRNEALAVVDRTLAEFGGWKVTA